MKIFSEANKKITTPKVSIILLDWSVRESIHSLHYLNQQSIPRDQYEIIWLEFYSKTHRDLKASSVDQLIVLEMPEDIYYHKHFMYNIGILASRGEIVVICDSDAMMRPTFIETILKEFEKDKNVVLHLDEVRNRNRRFYPFNFPSFEDVLGEGCFNWKFGRTIGLWFEWDKIHRRNYGACFAAKKDDLILIGGADEHLDYLGHICGPYDMTFRLKNLGRREKWLTSEFLYHTWHPGTDGEDNYLGPHDGKNMSTTALSCLKNKRILPLLENKGISALRNSKNPQENGQKWAEEILASQDIQAWKKSKLYTFSRYKDGKLSEIKRWILPRYIYHRLRLQSALLKLLIKELHAKSRKTSGGGPGIRRNLFEKVLFGFRFVYRMWKNNIIFSTICRRKAYRLRTGNPEIAIYGDSEAVSIFHAAGKLSSLNLKGTFNASQRDALKNFKGKVVIAEFQDISRKRDELAALGIPNEKILSVL